MSVAGRTGYNAGCLGSAWACVVWWIIILSPSGDCVRNGNGFTPMSAGWKAVKAALSRWGLLGECWVASTWELLPVSWYTVSMLFPMRRTYSPRFFLTDILLCMSAVMEFFSPRSSGVLNVRMFSPVANVCNFTTLGLFMNRTLSPRSFGLTLLILFSVMHVLSRMFAIPAGSSSGAY